MTGPTTPEAVADHLGGADQVDNDAIPAAVAAVNEWLASWTAPAGDEWPAHIRQGATMLAARLVRRRNSPAGVEAFGEMGATYVNRWDHDIALLLRMGRHSRLAVG